MTEVETTILRLAGVAPGGDVAKATATRANIFEMSQTAENAVLRPADCGTFPQDLRAALAARVARLGGDDALAEHYVTGAGDSAMLADPGFHGGDLAEVLTFVDKVANQTRDIVGEDIKGLQAAGVADADIVRLCELIAFLAYQTRVIAGLRLMQGPTA